MYDLNNRGLYDSLKSRSDRAYDYLYTELFPPFRAWVFRNNGADMDAEDAFQKGLLNFLLNLETDKYQFQETTKVTTVVFDYCKKVWLTELQSARFRNRANLSEASDPADRVDMIHDLQRMDTVNAVKNSMYQLKDDCRRLLEWFYVDELSLREIAEKLSMKESSVKSKRYECAEKLKAFYQRLANRDGL